MDRHLIFTWQQILDGFKVGGVRVNSALWKPYHLPELLDGEGYLQGASPTNQMHPSDTAFPQCPEGVVTDVSALWREVPGSVKGVHGWRARVEG